MKEELEKIKKEAENSLQELKSIDELEKWFKEFLGKKGKLSRILKGMRNIPPDKRPSVGAFANEIKEFLKKEYSLKEKELKKAKIEEELKAKKLDITLPGRPIGPGHLHIVTQTLREIYKVFASMGFQIYEAPDVETEENNFELLNIPAYHPAREMWDTFWINDKVLLRTHTSPGQIRVMREYYPEPIRVILPGKCYRYEDITARSEHQFYQVEGLAVGHNITLTDLKGTMINAAKRLFGEERKVRFRGSYFPFTEPSVEVDMDCILCKGKGCRVCKYTGWLEIAGAGMTHPVVLKNGGYDPDEWTGFAFGMGVERPAMLKYGIEDIRYFYKNDLRFLRQF
ncbi:MAG: phenylalanine--tRNA ligase subunit alpha [Deltaproteobacteria bacterium]|nr:phenylalanine--tRNA ligase subunit alpha [Deltaproteobacteria bacterium]